MPSKDQILPGVNDWMDAGVLERLSATESPASTPGTSRTAKTAPVVQALAARSGSDAEEMASKIPADTLRRCKYPVIPVPQADGSTRYDRDIVHRDERTGNLPNLAKDFSPERGGEGGHDPDERPRDSKGRYTK